MWTMCELCQEVSLGVLRRTGKLFRSVSLVSTRKLSCTVNIEIAFSLSHLLFDSNKQGWVHGDNQLPKFLAW